MNYTLQLLGAVAIGGLTGHFHQPVFVTTLWVLLWLALSELIVRSGKAQR